MRIVKKKRVVRGSAGADSKDDTANAEQPTSKFGATCSVVVKKIRDTSAVAGVACELSS